MSSSEWDGNERAIPAVPDPRSPGDDEPVRCEGKEIEYVTQQCQTCGQMGPWVETIREKSGRITQYSTWDIAHERSTGHRKFWHLTLKRNYSEIW